MKTNVKISPYHVIVDTHEESVKKQKKGLKKKQKRAEESEIISPVEDMGEPLLTENIDKEQAKSSKIRDLNKVIKEATQVGYDPTQEKTERKDRDPIAVPGAAVSKKHSDFEKVELPTYLNFPSEQGVSQ